MNIKVVIPGRSDGDELSDALRELTRAICKARPDLDYGGGMAGPDSYGCPIDTPVFTMRRQYWGDCDCGAAESDAPHTTDCSLERPNFIYKPTGFAVRWYKWIGRDNELTGECPPIREMIDRCIASIREPAR